VEPHTSVAARRGYHEEIVALQVFEQLRAGSLPVTSWHSDSFIRGRCRLEHETSGSRWLAGEISPACSRMEGGRGKGGGDQALASPLMPFTQAEGCVAWRGDGGELQACQPTPALRRTNRRSPHRPTSLPITSRRNLASS